MKKIITALLVICVELGFCAEAFAHHSFAMFDMDKQATLTGTVKAFEWTAPHVWVWVIVDKGSDGIDTYGFEGFDPLNLSRWHGWNKHSLKVGDKVSVDYRPFRDNKLGGLLIKATLGDGRVLESPIPGGNNASR